MNYDKIYIIGFDNTEFLGYEGDAENRIWLNFGKFYGDDFGEQLTHGKTLLGGYPQGLAGRFQSYALAFGDLELFRSDSVFNLDPNSLITTFTKLPIHPLTKKN